jgi:hypothetical protein
MKKIIAIWIIFSPVILFTLLSCKKNNDVRSDQVPGFNKDIEAMVSTSGISPDNQQVFTDEVTGNIFLLNEGIAPDYLVDEFSFEAPASDTVKIYIRDHSFIHCLRKLSLSDTQTVKIKKTLRAYKTCNEQAIKKAKEIYNELRIKYKEKFKRLLNAYKTGSLTLKEFKTEVEALKKEFKTELKRLHLKEKLEDAFKTCLRECYIKLHGILDERQWNAFKDCLNQ